MENTSGYTAIYALANSKFGASGYSGGYSLSGSIAGDGEAIITNLTAISLPAEEDGYDEGYAVGYEEGYTEGVEAAGEAIATIEALRAAVDEYNKWMTDHMTPGGEVRALSFPSLLSRIQELLIEEENQDD